MLHIFVEASDLIQSQVHFSSYYNYLLIFTFDEIFHLAPRLTYLQSSSSTMGSAPKYTSDMQGIEPSKLAHQISSTPTVVNSPDQTSPFASSTGSIHLFA